MITARAGGIALVAVAAAAWVALLICWALLWAPGFGSPLLFVVVIPAWLVVGLSGLAAAVVGTVLLARGDTRARIVVAVVAGFTQAVVGLPLLWFGGTLLPVGA